MIAVSDQKVNKSCYGILRSDKYGIGVACYIRGDVCFKRRNVFSNSIVFFDLHISKSKPVLIGIFYRLPNVNTFLETFLNDLKVIDIKKKQSLFSWRFQYQSPCI